MLLLLGGHLRVNHQRRLTEVVPAKVSNEEVMRADVLVKDLL